MTLTLYSRPDCQPCRAVKRFLDQRDIPYLEVDLEGTPAAAERLHAEGYRSAPVLVVGGIPPYGTTTTIEGYRPDVLRTLVSDVIGFGFEFRAAVDE